MSRHFNKKVPHLKTFGWKVRQIDGQMDVVYIGRQIQREGDNKKMFETQFSWHPNVSQ